MKNYMLLLSTFLFFSFFLSAQKVAPPIPVSKKVNDMTTIDTATTRIWYALNAVNISDTLTYDDLQRLDISERFSKYYSFFIYNSDSLIFEWNKKHPRAQSSPMQLGFKSKKDYWVEHHYAEYLKDFSLNVLTEYSQMPMYLQQWNCQYTEKMPVQSWTIHKQFQTVAGYFCQKATCVFRGREYIAWFTKDIPLNNGPWKFGGLPGLILKVYDQNNLFVFECIGVEYNRAKFPLKIHNDYSQYAKRERTEVREFQKKVNEDFMNTANMRITGGTFPEREPYFTLELE